MNTNIDNINEFIRKTFDPLTTRKESFTLKLKQKDYKLIISFLQNNYILFTCSSNFEYFGNSMHKNDVNNSFQNIDQTQKKDIIKLINTNILSIKEFINLDLIILCLSEKNSGDTIFEFFLNKLNEKTMNNDVIKMLFKKKENKQDDEYNKIIDSNTNTLDTFNRMYGLNIKGDEVNLELSFTNGATKFSPLQKISTKGFLLFCKNKFPNLFKLVLKNNDINELNIFHNLNTSKLKHLDLSANNISSLSPLTDLNFPRLEKLVLSKNHIKDISYLKNIKAPLLRDLDLSVNQIENINVLEYSSWPHLKSLDLSYNKITSVEVFKTASFPVLEYFNLNTNSIKNFEPLTTNIPKIMILILNQNSFSQLDFLTKCNFKNLKEIYLYSCNISTIYSLQKANFPNLVTLSLPENNIENITSLQYVNFPKLKKLSLYGNKIADIYPLQYAKFPDLVELYLYQNKIRDIKCLNEFKFNKLITLSLMSNEINDISIFKYTPMNDRLETLALSKNKILDISVFSDYSTRTFLNLKELWLDYNEISNIDKLDRAKISKIVRIKLGHNIIQKINSIPRMSFFSLNEIDLSNNVIDDLYPLNNIRMYNLKKINLANNSFVVNNNINIINTVKNKGIQVILQNEEELK